MDWVQRLNQAFAKTEWTVAKLARQSGVAVDSVRKYLEGKVEKPRGNNLDRLANALGVSPIWLKEGIEPTTPKSVVPVMGYVGAGSTVEPEFEQVPEAGLDRVEIPLALPEDLIAFEVRGESMQPTFKPGMVIVTYRNQSKQIERYFGQEAVVRTKDGRRLVKTILRGSSPKTVNLFSVNGGMIEDVEISWIGEIVAYFPSNQVRHLLISDVA